MAFPIDRTIALDLCRDHETDGVKMNSNVYAYSGGPGLQGKNNRRTQRLLLRVRPVYAETDIMVTVRSTGRPQAGCAVYDRAIEDEKFTLLGQTDWRGRFTVRPPAQNPSILPKPFELQRKRRRKRRKKLPTWPQQTLKPQSKA